MCCTGKTHAGQGAMTDCCLRANPIPMTKNDSCHREWKLQFQVGKYHTNLHSCHPFRSLGTPQSAGLAPKIRMGKARIWATTSGLFGYNIQSIIRPFGTSMHQRGNATHPYYKGMPCPVGRVFFHTCIIQMSACAWEIPPNQMAVALCFGTSGLLCYQVPCVPP